MSELRHDPLQHHWVIIAGERARRPSDYSVEVKTQSAEFCPFCSCNEDKTPPEIYAVREGYGAPNSPGWQIRVVPNKYPALRVEGELERIAVGLYDRMNGIGAHEIVIETPEHMLQMADFTAAHLALVLRVYRDRMRDLMQDKRLQYLVVFRNYGESAGTTLSHPHSQIIAMPILPSTIQTEIRSACEYYYRRERGIFCDIIHQELDDGSRIVIENDHYVVLAPYASRSPFELMLAPRRHQHDFTAISDSECKELAVVLKQTLGKLRTALNDPPFNLMIHTAPNLTDKSVWYKEFPNIKDGYHWYIEIVPRLTKSAGFEWGTGFHINPTPPESAAEFLRQIPLEVKDTADITY